MRVELSNEDEMDVSHWDNRGSEVFGASQRRINQRLTAKPMIIDMIVNSCEDTKIL